jgi:hypothetical protein
MNKRKERKMLINDFLIIFINFLILIPTVLSDIQTAPKRFEHLSIEKNRNKAHVQKMLTSMNLVRARKH